MGLHYTWLDVFAERAYQGNQLCVFRAPANLPVEAMQQLARELNHSETAFVQPAVSGQADYRLRIFIPTHPLAVEIPFAGHPILGSACAVADGRPVVRFETGAGVIPVTVTSLGPNSWEATMMQPVPRLVRTVDERSALAGALGLAATDLRPDVPIEAADNGMQSVLIPLTAVEAVQRARPDLPELRALLGRDGLSTMIFALGGTMPGAHVHCRVFSPFDLVAEDPATGSANGPLGEYLVRHGLVRGNRIVSEQGMEMGRPSRLVIEVERSNGRTLAVQVGGRVQRIGSGEFIGG